MSARRAALREFGYVSAVRDEMLRVWYGRWFEAAEALARDIRFALRSPARAKALTVTVAVTLALGIGANAAIFSVVRSVLLRPLVNREADRVDVLQAPICVGVLETRHDRASERLVSVSLPFHP
jgi:hypothetical protein